MIPAPLVVVTDRHGSNRPLAETVRAALAGGARWIWLRDRDMDREARKALALELLVLVRAAGGTLTVGGDADLAVEIGADGVHLGMGASEGGPGRTRSSAHQPVLASGAEVRDAPLLVGLSAHGLGDVRRAAEDGAGYVTLSPVFPSASKPGYGPPLGLDGLRDAAAIGLPVIALGGIDSDNAKTCRRAGAAGVAVMGAIMRAADPEAVTRRFCAALRTAT